MPAIRIQYLQTAYGELILGSYCGRLCLCDWRYRKARNRIDRRITKGLAAGFKEQDDAVLAEARRQLQEYFAAQRQQFRIPLLPVGTPFQRSVWEGLQRISYGSTCSYSELAQNVAAKNAVRAVANANAANALSLFIPCHRVVGIDGQLVGYAGGHKTKQQLLQLEAGYAIQL